MSITNYPGGPYPLGATWDGQGVNFALYAENATGVELCLFDSDDHKKEIGRVKVTQRSHHVWHVYLPDAKPGQLYGYRVYGPYEPIKGLRFNPNKLLISPYAKAITGPIEWQDALYGYQIGDAAEDLSFSEVDSAPYVPKAVVIDPHFDWEDDKRPNIPYHKTIFYEAHVKGFTKLNPDIPEEIRGTYAGLAHPASIEYLKNLGINALELLPVHQFIIDRQLHDKNLTNYWGYNTIGFFAPDVRYAATGNHGQQVVEFKNMVKAMHKAGIEVILDVVYNHTGEGNQLGPTVSFRGIDNSIYYRLVGTGRYHMDYTGTGNTLNVMQPSVLRIIMDSLRYWILEMHVDGFRFDLAATLARELHEVDRLGSFFDIIHQDPVISQVKLIAEPWDIGEGGYQVGKFPPGWAEWNGMFRDCMRDFWRGANSMLEEFALRLTGSPDLYFDDYRHPFSSINFITAHDGFTLHDLVSYNEKHNMDNGEENRDGENENRSWNCGEEGPTENPEIIKLRNRQKRNFLVSLFLSQGVPMLVAGDELGRTQKGNNNAYCQDNEISWIDWQGADKEMLDFTQKLIHFYKQHLVFCRRKWFKGKPVAGLEVEDIAWFLPEGIIMPAENWKHDFAKSLAMFLSGKSLRTIGPKGEKEVDDDFYLIFNSHSEEVPYKLPPIKYGNQWIKVIDTAEEKFIENGEVFAAEAVVKVSSHSAVVLQQKIMHKR